jgi:hypothetical protein
MAPKFLTGDKAGIEEFLNKFDVGPDARLQMNKILTACRSSCSTAMVRNCPNLDHLYIRYDDPRTNEPTETDDTRRIGVLWSGDHLFEGTKETIEMLRSKGRHTPVAMRRDSHVELESQESNWSS